MAKSKQSMAAKMGMTEKEHQKHMADMKSGKMDKEDMQAMKSMGKKKTAKKK